MAKQFTAIMAREAIIGPTINSQADGSESNIGRKGYCGELEREIKGRGLSFYLCFTSVSVTGFLYPFSFFLLLSFFSSLSLTNLSQHVNCLSFSRPPHFCLHLSAYFTVKS